MMILDGGSGMVILIMIILIMIVDNDSGMITLIMIILIMIIIITIMRS